MNRRARILIRLALAGLLLATAGCGNANLGAIDDKPDSREVMPGPGVFDDSDGKTPLQWSSDSKSSAASAAQAEAAGSVAPSAQEKAEFEEFKLWNRLRTEGKDSPEYREFQQWLQYRRFKAAE